MVQPKLVLRIGSHAEKEYFEKLAKNIDCIMFGGNLLEITPAATASFLILLKTKRAGKPIAFYLDPMTYCFGPYLDPKSGKKRFDMESLKSEKLIKRGGKERVRSIKDSYKQLGPALGAVFATAIGDGQSCHAIDYATLSGKQKHQLCSEVIGYQWGRIASILAEDELMAESVNEARPAAIFAPYFFVSQSWADSGLVASIELAKTSVEIGGGAPIHAIFCGAAELLDSREYVERLAAGLIDSGVSGAWFWFDGFDEFAASTVRLKNFRRLVSLLRGACDVYNLHGGYFSLLLSHDGLTGVSHGVGYGERKDVAQVIGAAAPTVRFYLPAISMRIGIPELQLALDDARVDTVEKYFEIVCKCQICKGVLASGLNQLDAFGEMHKTNVLASRFSQTPAAAKMCRYHFLLNRLQEPALVSVVNGFDRAAYVRERAARWRDCDSLQRYLGKGEGYLERWAQALSEGNSEQVDEQ